ncbi:hypothetical protein TNCV_4255861 [Trichonephila clavipes]|nr:hypothetical protein TNCV_4255861 [Trichonephila clavipes]
MGRLLTGNVVACSSWKTEILWKGTQLTTTLSMHVGNIPLQNLWELEVLGIIDPTETVKEREDLSDFREKMRIPPKGDMK